MRIVGLVHNNNNMLYYNKCMAQTESINFMNFKDIKTSQTSTNLKTITNFKNKNERFMSSLHLNVN